MEERKIEKKRKKGGERGGVEASAIQKAKREIGMK